MRLDDGGARAGAELRLRFADEYPPPLPPELLASPAHRTDMSRAVLVSSGVIAIAVIAALVAAAVAVRDPVMSRGERPMWQRISVAKAFGRGAEVTRVIGTANGFLAWGSRAGLNSGDRVPAVWSSPGGTRWKVVPRSVLPVGRVFIGVSNGDRTLIVAGSGPRRRIWCSGDGESWQRGVRLNPRRFVTVRPWDQGFVVLLQGDNGANETLTSADDCKLRRELPSAGVLRMGIPPDVRLGDRYLSRFAQQGRVMVSRDGLVWQAQRSNIPENIDKSMQVSASGQFAVGIDRRNEREDPERFGRLLRTTDGLDWNEIESFRRRFPRADPASMTRVGEWWVVGGRSGYETETQADLWASPDLEHWIELPPGLRGIPMKGYFLEVVASGKTAVSFKPFGKWIRIFRPPATAPKLVRVSGVWEAVGGPAPGERRPMPGRIAITNRIGELVDAAYVGADGRYALDLEPGRYTLDGPCGVEQVRVRNRPMRRDVLCQMR